MAQDEKSIGVFDIVDVLPLKCIYLPVGAGDSMSLVSERISRFSACLVDGTLSFKHKVPVLLNSGEVDFLQNCSESVIEKIFRNFLSSEVPMLVLTSEVTLSPFCARLFKKCDVPVFKIFGISQRVFESKYKAYLAFCLARKKTLHGVLVEVYGTGVLIAGKSGVGKSECAVELIKRGHRFIADDAVEIRRLENNVIVGTSPKNIRDFLELRGVGVVNIRVLFGVAAIKQSQRIDLIISLVDWKTYENKNRLLIASENKDLLGLMLPILKIPVGPGRSASAVIETAVINMKGKSIGYDATTNLVSRITKTKNNNEQAAAKNS